MPGGRSLFSGQLLISLPIKILPYFYKKKLRKKYFGIDILKILYYDKRNKDKDVDGESKYPFGERQSESGAVKAWYE
jgi:hypothetical protein